MKGLLAEEDRSELSFILAEAREYTQLLASWSICQVKRECNSVAHELAHLARRTTHSAVWLGRASACVTDLVKNECNHLHPS
jgi:hypothetical protein